MATVTIRPTGDHTIAIDDYYDSTTVPNGVPNYSVIDEVELDTGDYISYSYKGSLCAFKYSSANINVGDTVNSITVHIKGSIDGTPVVRITTSDSTQNIYIGAATLISSGYWTLSVATHPLTGTAFTVNDVNGVGDNICFAIEMTGGDKGNDSLYQLYLVVDYTEGQSGTTHEGEATLSSTSYIRTMKSQ